jgi:hypothetical protein
MSVSVPTAQQVNTSHLIAGVTGALAIHRVTKKIPVGPVVRLSFLALVAVAIAYWHRKSNSPAPGSYAGNGATFTN